MGPTGPGTTAATSLVSTLVAADTEAPAASTSAGGDAHTTPDPVAAVLRARAVPTRGWPHAPTVASPPPVLAHATGATEAFEPQPRP